jgi:hypothetical protein
MLSRRKAGHREMIWFLLSAAGLLGGCITRSGYKPVLPESCVWTKFPYTWICIDPKEGEAVPGEETKLWGSYPLENLDFEYSTPLQWEDLVRFTKSCPVVPLLEDLE